MGIAVVIRTVVILIAVVIGIGHTAVVIQMVIIGVTATAILTVIVIPKVVEQILVQIAVVIPTAAIPEIMINAHYFKTHFSFGKANRKVGYYEDLH